MPGKFEAPRNGGNQNRRRPGRKRKRFQPLILLPLVLVLVIAALILTRCGKQENGNPKTPGTQPTTAAATTETTLPPPAVVATASIAAQGDLLMHRPIFTQDPKNPSACNLGDGIYNFDSIFQYITPYVSAADYAAANLETTFGGDEFPYQGNPSFNCPDALTDSLVSAGYDMLLTANNHCYDTLMTGINRTLEQVRGKGLDTLGTRLSEDEPRYSIVEVNGIKIGMVCYTYTMSMDGSKPSLNNNSAVEKPEQVNYFSTANLSGFYSEMEPIMADMKTQGAEATMLFIHWGTEYELTENDTQRAIAQEMCDMGFDVIVGGHPHVVQPMDLLTSTTDPEHKTVCIYSLGNAVSNQRREEMRLNTGHTEDGVLFSVTFEKYDDGGVYVADCDVLPTWVNKFVNADGKVEYNILPLDVDCREQWKTQFGLTDELYNGLQESYSRTMDIVETGLTKCQEYLQQAKQQREQDGSAVDLAA